MSALEYITGLMDSRQCTGSCLLGRDGESCACRCNGEHHGKALDALGARGDGLVGRYFVEMKKCPSCFVFPNRSGRISTIIAPGIYLRRYFSAISGAPDWGESMVGLDDMAEYTFYASIDEMTEAWEYGGLSARLEYHAMNCDRPDPKEENKGRDVRNQKTAASRVSRRRC